MVRGMRQGILILAAALLMGCQTGSTRSDSTEIQIPPCGPENAESVTVAAIATAPNTYSSHCVRVSGIKNGFTLYADVDGIYRTGVDLTDPSSNGSRVGLDNLSRSEGQ